MSEMIVIKGKSRHGMSHGEQKWRVLVAPEQTSCEYAFAFDAFPELPIAKKNKHYAFRGEM